MSLWNRIGDVASTVAKGAFNFGKDVVGAPVAVAKMAWDIGTAPWNDAAQYNGFMQTIKTAGKQNIPNIVKPLADAGGAIMKVPGLQPALERINYVNQQYIREPLTTLNLVQGDILSGRVGPSEIFNPNEWRAAYKGAQDISFGQSFVNFYRVMYDPKFNIYDPREREQAFKNSAWGKWTSGSVDTLAQLFGDVTLAAGKGAKLLKASELMQGTLKSADVVAKAAEDLTKAQYGETNRFTKVIDDFTNNDSIYALNHPIVKSSDQPGLLAYLLGDAKDKDTTAFILRTALGDPAARDELALLRADMGDALAAARAQLSSVDEYKLFSAPDGTGMIPFLNDNPAIIAEAEANYAALAKADENFAKMMSLSPEGIGSLTRTTGKLTQGFEDFVANARSMRFYDKKVGNPNIEVFQPTPFHRLYQKISWAENERPAGIVDLNDPDSYKEVVATLERLRPTAAIKGTPSNLKRIGIISDEEANALLDNYIKAATPEARQAAVLNIESTGIRRLAERYNIDPETADQIYNTYKGARTSGLRSIQDKGFMVDTDGSILKVPQFESQTADHLPVMDFELMDRLLKENASTLQLIKGKVLNPTLNIADILQDIFKAGALIRLGYTVRNGIDSQLRIASAVGAMTTLRHLGPGLKHIVNNTIRVPARLIDTYLPVHEGVNIKQVQQSVTAVARDLSEIKTKIKDLEAKSFLRSLDKSFFHGTSSPLELDAGELKWIHNNADSNLFGSGFYTTDDIDTAIGYTKKGHGSEPTVYKVSWNKATEPKLLNLDENLTPEIKNIFIKTIKKFDSEYDLPYGLDDVIKQIEKFDITGSDAWQLLKRELEANAEEAYGASDEILYEGIERLSKALEENGYDGLAHTGGSFRGKKDHNVNIFFNPLNLSLKQIDQFDKDLDLAGELNTLKLLQEEKNSVYQHYTDIINKVGITEPKQRIGTGTYKVNLSDGTSYDLYDAFGGPLGDMFRKLASSGNTFQRMVESNSNMFSRKLQTKGFGAVKSTDPGYFEQWAQTLRQQFGNSAVIKKIVAGQTLEDITRWLVASPEGRDLRRRLAIPSEEAAEYVTKINGFFDTYLPKQSGLREKLRDLTAADLRSVFNDPTELPIIHGHVLEEALNNTSKINIRKVINGIFHLLGTLPEDTWARNPLYVQLYRQEARRRIEIAAGLKEGFLTPAEQEAIMGASHKMAIRQMKSILFNIERRTNLAAAMKFISPFFSAQENAYKTWLNLAAANPAIVNRGYNVWQAPNRSSLVTDQDGNPVPEGKTSGDDVIWISLPKSIRSLPGLSSLTYTGIPKQSLDIIFQGGMDVLYNKGNPNVFSDIFPVGPYVAVPIGELVKKKPSLEDAFKWALPYGAPKDALSGFLPAWVNKAQVGWAELDDAQFARTYDLIFATEQTRAKRNGRPAVSPDKIMRMTQDYWKMRMYANLILPFAPRFDSPYRFWINKSREYKRKFGMEADAKFLDDFPEFFAFTASTSKNPAKVDYTITAVKNIEKYSDLVTELASIEPKLIGTIVNDKDGYKFSQAAYQYLYNKNIAPNSKEKFLSSQDPLIAQKANEAEKGWIQYGKLRDLIDAELAARGLTSIQQKGAEDLAIVKTGFIRKLAQKVDDQGNPVINPKTGQIEQTAWYDDYLDSDGSKTNRIVMGLGKILSDKTFMDDHKKSSTWKSIATYFDLRQAIAGELQKRPVKSIDAKANFDLRIIYDGFVNKLVKDDPIGFGALYNRFLTQDLIVDKYLTPQPPKETK